MAGLAVWPHSTQAFGEAEGSAEPVDRFVHVFVDEGRYDGSWGSGSIDYHAHDFDAFVIFLFRSGFAVENVGDVVLEGLVEHSFGGPVSLNEHRVFCDGF